VAEGRVLVVDDEDGIRVLCRVNLELAGYDVLEAGDGATALELARAQRPDLIFLDVMMPQMDGWDVLRKLKEDAGTASIPVVMLTARTSEADQIRAWGEGILDYLAKPFNPQALEDFAAAAMRPRDASGEHQRRQQVVDHLRHLQELRRRQ
jgi:DNA-binding response OmpR family regulator